MLSGGFPECCTMMLLNDLVPVMADSFGLRSFRLPLPWLETNQGSIPWAGICSRVDGHG